MRREQRNIRVLATLQGALPSFGDEILVIALSRQHVENMGQIVLAML